MKTLLLEIGTEEIPAGYIAPALAALSQSVQKRLTDARIDHGETRVFGTPRRLAIRIDGVAEQQAPLTETVVGPPASVGYDADGNPTVAAQKFAEKLGVALSDIRVEETPKGRYLVADRADEGSSTVDFLAGTLPEVILSTPFPKTMKWADLSIYFARPIFSLCALFGETVIPLTLGNVHSDRQVAGHRFMAPDPIRLDGPETYADKLRDACVIADFEERRRLIETEITRVAEAAGGRVLDDPELLDINTNLVEYPAVVAGRFDDVFLELPPEVLITAMREHQKYFAVIDADDRLMPWLISVNNTQARDMALVAKGHERVIRARLADAQFFYRTDLEISADERLERLRGVLFQAKLGSMYDKVLRVRQVAEALVLAAGGDDILKADVDRAAALCKTDLVSNVVVEFPKLQGVMGRVYAVIAREPRNIPVAIEEHYRPTYSGGPLPETLTGAILAIADKIDSICGCFSVDLRPTGAADPYALRRQGIGLLQIIASQGLTCSLTDLIRTSADRFADLASRPVDDTVADVAAFLTNRMVGMLVEEGFSRDVVAAAVAVSSDNVLDVWNRVRALEKLKAAPDFDRLAIGFKRVVNILKKTDTEVPETVDESLFEHDSESALLAAYRRVRSQVNEDLEKGLYDQALMDIVSLRSPVDAFFDGVLVMADDPTIRRNRLALLQTVATLFDGFADFSKIST